MSYLVWLAENPIIAFVLLFVQFVIFMKLHHKYHTKLLHTILAIIFQPQNFIVNTVAISLIGWEVPNWQVKEYVTTARMHRWKTLDPTSSKLNSWRFIFATKLCEQLNKYDAGHC